MNCILTMFLVHSTVHHWSLIRIRASPRNAALSLLRPEYCLCLLSCQVQWTLHFRPLLTEDWNRKSVQNRVKVMNDVWGKKKCFCVSWQWQFDSNILLSYLVSFLRTVVLWLLMLRYDVFLFRVSADNMIIKLCLIAFCKFCILFTSVKLIWYLGL
jgi:hypothetical protein